MIPTDKRAALMAKARAFIGDVREWPALFDDETPGEDDVALCYFCGQALNDPENDVHLEDTKDHVCLEAALSVLAQTVEKSQALLGEVRDVLEWVKAYGAADMPDQMHDDVRTLITRIGETKGNG